MHVYKSWPSHFDVAESLVTNHTTNLEPLNDNITEHTVASQKGNVGVAESSLRGRRRNKPRKGLGSQDSITRSPENNALMMAHLLIWRQSKCLRGDNARWVTTTLRSGISGEQRRNNHVTRRSLIVQPNLFVEPTRRYGRTTVRTVTIATPSACSSLSLSAYLISKSYCSPVSSSLRRWRRLVSSLCTSFG